MNPYIDLAKKAVEEYVINRKILALPADLPDQMTKRQKGVFVTLEKKGQLRGCIGTFLPIKANIAQEVIANAIAATNDPRLLPVTEEELEDLSYTVYLLNEPELIRDIAELDPKKYGIIVKTANQKLALLLPDLKEIETVEQQVAAVCQKGGIDPLREQISIFRFSVEKFS